MVAVFDEPGDTIFGGFVIRVRLRSGLEPLFAAAMFHAPSIRKLIVESAGTGTITNINQPALLALPVVVPPAELQREFVQRLLSVESIQHQQSLALSRADGAFYALLCKAFLAGGQPELQGDQRMVTA